jgi:adenine deaminase
MNTISDLMGNVRTTIENGLQAADAVRAFTIWPAQILGVQDQVGTIEVGKIANLTVTRGDLFDRGSRVTHVFIDGRPVDLRPAVGGGGPGAGRNSSSGAWTVNIKFEGMDDKSITLTLQQEGERLNGSIAGPLGAGEISNGSASNTGEVRFTVSVNVEGQTKEATFTGRLANNEIRGSVAIVGSAPGTFTATRSGEPN